MDAHDQLLSDGFVDPTSRAQEEKPVAPRLQSLSGARCGILDNRKGNGDVLLEALVELLQRRHGIGHVNMVQKFIYARRADPSILDELSQSSDFVLTAVGD